MNRYFSVLAAAGLAMTIGACSSSPIPGKYALPAPAIAVDNTANRKRLLITRLQLPGYARNAAVSTLEADFSVTESRTAQWASPPAESIASVLARHLESTDEVIVAQRPVDSAYREHASLAILFDVFARLPNNGALMEGQVRIVTAQSHDVIRFSLRTLAEGDEMDSYMRATSDGLADLAALIKRQLDTLME